MSNQPNRAPIPLNQFDVFTNWMYATPMDGATKRPSFRLKILGNVPRFIVKTNVPDDKNHGKIEFNTDVETFTAIITILDDLAQGKIDGSYAFEYNDFVFNNGQRSDKPMTKATIRLGKDAESGQIYIAVLGYQRPAIRFFFGPSDRHALKGGDGSNADQGFISRTYARACATWWSNVCFGLLNQQFDENARNVAKAPTPGGQGGGGHNQYQNNTRQQNHYGNGGGGNSGGSFSGGNAESFDDFGDSAF